VLPVPELVGQFVHADASADVALNVPMAHSVVLPPEPVKPTSAKQLVSKLAAVAPPVPELTGQSSHAAAPVAALYVSATQSLHDDGGPVWPVPQPFEQSEMSSDPAALFGSLTGHEPHESDVCPGSVLYLPEAQLVQAAADSATLNVPAAQAVKEGAVPV
jgi:hypothetical protein